MSLLLSILVGLELENAAVVDSANIVLAHDTVFWPEQEIRGQPFEEARAPAEEIKRHSLPFMESNKIINVKAAFVTTIVL